MTFLNLKAKAASAIYNKLGEAATCTPVTGEPFTLKVIRETEENLLPDGYDSKVSEDETILFASLASYPAPEKADVITIGSESFTVIRARAQHQVEWSLIVRAD